MIVHADNMDPARGLPSFAANTFDAMVTDPPSGINFMGLAWDGSRGGRDRWIAWLAGIMREALRVLKPGAHALVWALPRVSHWTTTAVEDAGFEIRDVHHDVLALDGVAKAFVASLGADQRAAFERCFEGIAAPIFYHLFGTGMPKGLASKTTLKPAVEHWILARKPFVGTVAANRAAFGTGALNIDACRVETDEVIRPFGSPKKSAGGILDITDEPREQFEQDARGRWPAHLSLDEVGAAVLDVQSGLLRGGNRPRVRRGMGLGSTSAGGSFRGEKTDAGGASRFFYVAKPSTSERTCGGEIENDHETVKSIALMRWLVRLITPPGGIVIDPFAGSGSTGIACIAEGAQFVGIEQDEKYVGTAHARLALVAKMATTLPATRHEQAIQGIQVKLYNTVVVYDIYTVAESPEAASAAALAAIRATGEPLPCSTAVALEVTHEREVRDAWRAERPLVGDDVSDEDFATLKGKTTEGVYQLLHTKSEPA